MRDTATEIYPNTVTKYSTSKKGELKVARELRAYLTLEGSVYIPRLIEAHLAQGAEPASFTIEHINTPTVAEELGIGPNWRGEFNTWQKVKPILTELVAAETDFLGRNVLYRDLAPRHIFVSDELNPMKLIDLESSLTYKIDGVWQARNPLNVAYETMAPEEFSRHIKLGETAATYHSAVFAHLALTGRLPFPRWLPKIAARAGRNAAETHFGEGLPEDAQAVIRKALSHSPEQRYSSPDVFLGHLGRTLE